MAVKDGNADVAAAKTVSKGDLVGWGVLYVEEDLHHDEEQLVICYLTVNRKVLLVRVVYQPPGGFYPLVILPQGGGAYACAHTHTHAYMHTCMHMHT